MELRRNEKTGIVEAWGDGKVVGEVITMGDEVDGTSGRSKELSRRSGKADDEEP